MKRRMRRRKRRRRRRSVSCRYVSVGSACRKQVSSWLQLQEKEEEEEE